MDNFIQDSTQVILDILRQISDKEFKLNEKISFLDNIIFWD